jgi:hypothetical protein
MRSIEVMKLESGAISAYRNKYVRCRLKEGNLSKDECFDLIDNTLMFITFDEELMDDLIPYLINDAVLATIIEEQRTAHDFIVSAKYFKYFAHANCSFSIADEKFDESLILDNIDTLSNKKLIMSKLSPNFSDTTKTLTKNKLAERFKALDINNIAQDVDSREAAILGSFLEDLNRHVVIDRELYIQKINEAEDITVKFSLIEKMIEASIHMNEEEIDETVELIKSAIGGVVDANPRKYIATTALRELIQSVETSDEQRLKIVDTFNIPGIISECAYKLKSLDMSFIEKYWDMIESEHTLHDHRMEGFIKGLSITDKNKIWTMTSPKMKFSLLRHHWFNLNELLEHVKDFDWRCWDRLVRTYKLPEEILIKYNREIVMYTGDVMVEYQIIPDMLAKKYEIENVILASKDGCGEYERIIIIPTATPNIIKIGCSSKNREDSIEAVKRRYEKESNGFMYAIEHIDEVRDKYIAAINECFEDAAKVLQKEEK